MLFNIAHKCTKHLGYFCNKICWMNQSGHTDHCIAFQQHQQQLIDLLAAACAKTLPSTLGITKTRLLLRRSSVYFERIHEIRTGTTTAKMAIDPTFLVEPLQRSLEQKHSLVEPRSRHPSRFVPWVSWKQSLVTAINVYRLVEL